MKITVVRIGKEARSSSHPPLPRLRRMRLPKYFNPHLAVDATRPISRKTLRNDVGDEVEPGGEAGGVGLARHEVEGMHEKLEEIVSKRLKLKRVLAPTDEPRSNKRSKLLVEEGEVQLVGPEQTSGPIGELESSYSPQVSHQPLPSFSSRIEITATSCHLFDPETSQGCTVSLPL